MNTEILNLKKLNAAFIAAKEFDYCPGSSKAKKVMSLFEVGISSDDLKDALDENEGSRSDEIANEMSRVIIGLPDGE